MFICEVWLFDWYFPQLCKSDMSKYGYLKVFQRVPLTSRELTLRVDCICVPDIMNLLNWPGINVSTTFFLFTDFTSVLGNITTSSCVQWTMNGESLCF